MRADRLVQIRRPTEQGAIDRETAHRLVRIKRASRRSPAGDSWRPGPLDLPRGGRAPSLFISAPGVRYGLCAKGDVAG